MGSVSKDYYYKLASDVKHERIAAATGLIEDLTKADSKDEWKYATNRLIKGLASSRDSARLGFSLCLSEVLNIMINTKHIYTIKRYLNDLDSKLILTGNKKGHELRSNLFGRLFGYQAILNSEVVLEDAATINTIYKLLVDLGLTKSWIREICFVTIFNHLSQLDQSTKKSVTVTLLKLLKESDLILSQEGLLIYLAIDPAKRARWSKLAGITDQGWDNADPLTIGNLEKLGNVLVDSSDPSKNPHKNRQLSTWNPKIHFVWKPLLMELASPNNGTKNVKRLKTTNLKPNRLTLIEFWNSIIDQKFFKSSSSSERKYWGFEILQQALSIPSLTIQQVECILSPNILHSLINQSSKQQRTLHTLAHNILDNLVISSTKYEERRVPILKKLLEVSIRFDSITKSKTVNKLLTSSTTVGSIQEVLQFLLSMDDTKEDIANRQEFILGSMLKIIRTNKKLLVDQIKPLQAIIKYSVEHAFFIKRTAPEHYTERIAKLSLERFYSILSESMSIAQKYNWPMFVVKQLSIYDPQLDGCDTTYQIRYTCEEPLASLKKEAAQELEDIDLELKKATEDKLEVMKCFEILFCVALIELSTGDPDSASVIFDLSTAYKNSKDWNGMDTGKLMEVLVDLILSYANQKSILMKKVATITWRNIISKVSEKDISRLLEILETRENKEGQQQLFDQGEVEDESSGNESDKFSDATQGDLKTSDLELSADESKDNDKDAVDKIECNISKSLSNVLNVSENKFNMLKPDSNDEDSDEEMGESNSDDDSNISEDSMSDEEMMALDSTLSQIFKQRKAALQAIRGKSGNQRKLEAHEAREMMQFFKGRVLDLLEIFCHSRNEDPLNLKIAISLVDLIGLTMDKNLGMKAAKLLRNICSSNTMLTSEDESLATLQLILGYAETSKLRAHTNACNRVASFITKRIYASFGQEALEKALILYFETFKSWLFDINTKMTSGMFIELINWANGMRQSQIDREKKNKKSQKQ